MPKLTAGPSPAAFAKAWSEGFAAAARAAAGKDGRLSESEIDKLAKQTDGSEIYADNAANWLDKSGQKTVGVDKLIGRAHDYAYAVADRVAGRDGRLSLVDARALPADLKLDFAKLRGTDEGSAPPPAALSADDRAKLLRELAPSMTLGWFGEDDGSSATFVRRKKPVGELTTESFLKAFGFDVDKQRASDQLSMQRVTSETWDGLIDTQWDDAGKAAMTKLRELMAGLDVAVFTVEDDRPFGAPCFLIARSPEGELFGVRADIGGMGF